jgi:hypothetical protein
MEQKGKMERRSRHGKEMGMDMALIDDDVVHYSCSRFAVYLIGGRATGGGGTGLS